jgi:hypothetical protein
MECCITLRCSGSGSRHTDCSGRCGNEYSTVCRCAGDGDGGGGRRGGLIAGLASVRFAALLLHGVKGTDVSRMVPPVTPLLVAAACAAVPAVLRAVRINLAIMLRVE